MESYSLVKCNNLNLYEVPTADLDSASKMRWWANEDMSGDNPDLHTRAKYGWSRYKDIQTFGFPTRVMPALYTPTTVLTWKQRLLNLVRMS